MDELYGQGIDASDPGTAADTGNETDQVRRPPDEASTGNWQENEEPLTRGEYADMMRQGPAVEQDDADDTGSGGDAFRQAIAEDDQEQEELPEPRTRQEVAEQEADTDSWATQEDRAHVHEAYLDWRQEVSAGWEQGTNVVGDKPDRSPDDRSGLPPAGEE